MGVNLMNKGIYIAGAALVALTACGGGGATFSGASGFPGLQSEFDNGVSLDALYSSAETPALSDNGVTYEGVVVVADGFASSGDGFIGDATFTVDFGDNSMTGDAIDFIYIQRSGSGPRPTSAVGTATGSLAFTGGTVSGGVNIDVAGDITFSGRTLTINDSISGAFQGPNAELYEETAFGLSASGDFQSEGTVDMQIYAERQ